MNIDDIIDLHYTNIASIPLQYLMMLIGSYLHVSYTAYIMG